MSIFYLHFCNGKSRTVDVSGYDFTDLQAAWQGSVKALREAMAWDIQAGEMCLGSFIEVEDSVRRHVATVRLADAVKITIEPACAPR
ncbi:hypothetical protein [Novosphingobium sp. G106]|uniref:DUF6894 family protein n=1 Tax=Novosphingobium sp. G106 TaxID=2849500 RepID=UPI0035C8025A